MFSLGGGIMTRPIIKMRYEQEPVRDILCIDVKSFFASVEAVERRIHPLKAMIAVVSKPNHEGGLVLASSPRVKERYGIRTGSRVYDIPKQAQIQIVEPRMALYLQKNLEIVQIFRQYVPDEDLHIYSIDESFLDVTGSKQLFGPSIEIAHKIQRQIFRELHLVTTVGIGDNPLLAKLALDQEAKYNAPTYRATWHYQDVEEKLWPITPLSDFWGIGKQTERTLHQLGIRSIYDLAQADLTLLKRKFGVIGEQLFFHAHGIDRTRLSDVYRPSSTSFSKNQILDRDYTDPREVELVIREMTEAIALRLRQHQQVTRLISLGIGYSKHCATAGFRRQMTIDVTDSTRRLIQYALQLFNQYYDHQPVRTVNISLGKRQPKQFTQLDLFTDPDEVLRDEQLDDVIDSIRQRFGYTSLLHASSLLQGGTAIKRSKLLGGHQANTD